MSIKKIKKPTKDYLDYLKEAAVHDPLYKYYLRRIKHYQFEMQRANARPIKTKAKKGKSS